MNIIIYGVPGSGKTTLARALSKALHLSYYEADAIRDIAQIGKTPQSHPFCFLPTTKAYEAIGPKTPQNVVKGMLKVRSALNEFIEQKVDSYKKGVVVEAAFLDPWALSKKGVVLLVTIPSVSRHRKLLRIRNGIFPHFTNTRLIQDFLIKEANQLHIPILENKSSLDDLINQALKYINIPHD